MYGELTFEVLKLIEDTAFTISDLLVICTTPYGMGIRGAYRRLVKHQNRQKSIVDAWHGRFIKKQAFFDLISRLKREGLIEVRERGDDKFPKLTTLGNVKLKILIKRKAIELPPKKYTIENSQEFKIVVFDIPEVDYRKRVWLRDVLKGFGFTMLQKSVWVGKAAIPQQFIEDIKRVDIIDYVQIFAISKKGSLRQLYTEEDDAKENNTK